ncbi:MAG TPA: phosphoketolase family protein [Acidobacteriota bacterium]|nr:phosphoketolase family protein [Acidobacteriota bacterium]
MSRTTPLAPPLPPALSTTGLRSTIERLARYRRAADYIAAAQIYLRANPLLREPLRPEHIKDRLLGHWGTAPGINLVYAHLNRLILDTGASVLLVTGPGHGAAANMANLWLEGTITDFYPDVTRDAAGLQELTRRFSWPYGFPSHLNPGIPGVIHEGGELGYALSTAFGAALDNPDLIVACIVGDGEWETGPTANSWHGTKFLNPATDGAVLPILLLNGFKIANPSLPGTMTEEELRAYFEGCGYAPHFVDDGRDVDADLSEAFTRMHGEIRSIQRRARDGEPLERPRWPMLVLRTPKGRGGPKVVDGREVEGTFRSHQVPVSEPKTNPKHLAILETWLRSYRPEDLFEVDGRPMPDLLEACPPRESRMAMNPAGFGGDRRVPLDLPPIEEFAVPVAPDRRGEPAVSNMKALGAYLAQVIQRNEEARNFRIVCPDELESNRLGAVLEVTDRQYDWPLPHGAEKTSRDGRVLEMLSEHMCQGWMEGYLLTGRHGLFPCYEAFVPIVDGMMNQYAKFLKASLEVAWRKPVSSLNYLLTSESWRQDHNGFSHQGPGFINNLLTKKGETYHIYLPPDCNTLLVTMEECLRSTDHINIVVSGKQPMHQWLSLEEAREEFRVGASIWRWASVEGGEDPQIVLAATGDNLTMEILDAAALLREDAPEWRVRVVNVMDLVTLGIPQKYPHGLDEGRFQRIFPLDAPVIYNFHGYTAAIKQLCWERPVNERFDINGYREEGSTTTPFDMHIRNRSSRYHIVIQTAQKLAAKEPRVAAKAERLIRHYERLIVQHRTFIEREGVDPPEISAWRWPHRGEAARRNDP